MSEAQESQAPETPTSPSCCPTSRPGCHCMRWLPILLLVAAGVLYLRDMRAARQRTEAANAVRSQIAGPIAGVSVSHKLEGRTLPFLVRCPVDVATNLLAAIAQAQPTRFPKGTVEGSEFEIHLVQTNATFSILRAVVLDSDPETLFVGVKTPAAKDADGKVTDWKVTQPAKVPGAGILMAELLKNIQDAAAKLPPDADILHSMSNAAQRASTPAVELPLNLPEIPEPAPDAPPAE